MNSFVSYRATAPSPIGGPTIHLSALNVADSNMAAIESIPISNSSRSLVAFNGATLLLRPPGRVIAAVVDRHRSPLARAEVEVTVEGQHATYRIDGEIALISNPMVSGSVLLVPHPTLH